MGVIHLQVGWHIVPGLPTSTSRHGTQKGLIMNNLLLQRRHVCLAVAMMGAGRGGNLPMRIAAPRLANLQAPSAICVPAEETRRVNSNCLPSANVECHVQHQILPIDLQMAILACMVPELQSWHCRERLHTLIGPQSDNWCMHLPRHQRDGDQPKGNSHYPSMVSQAILVVVQCNLSQCDMSRETKTTREGATTLKPC